METGKYINKINYFSSRIIYFICFISIFIYYDAKCQKKPNESNENNKVNKDNTEFYEAEIKNGKEIKWHKKSNNALINRTATTKKDSIAKHDNSKKKEIETKVKNNIPPTTNNENSKVKITMEKQNTNPTIIPQEVQVNKTKPKVMPKEVKKEVPQKEENKKSEDNNNGGFRAIYENGKIKWVKE